MKFILSLFVLSGDFMRLLENFSKFHFSTQSVDYMESLIVLKLSVVRQHVISNRALTE